MTPIRWDTNPAIPACVAALLASLRFADAPELQAQFSEAEWKAALYFCDRNQLTLLLRSGKLPAEVSRRIEENLAANRERIKRVKKVFTEVSDTLERAGIDFAVLKGFANWERFTRDPESRLQYDLDLYCPERAQDAWRELTRLGYESIGLPEQFPIDHLPALARKTGWQWKGAFFDPDIPIAVELHFRFWDEITEGFPAIGTEGFWERRIERRLDGRAYFALDSADALAYAALHLLRHLLRGDIRASNVYELAYFLHQNAGDAEFWTRWRGLHPPELRRLQAICFRLAADWFDCSLSPIAAAVVEALPLPIQRWFERCTASPVEAFFRPNKDELWLHLCLLDSFQSKAAILLRRLIPTRLPGPLDSVFIPPERMTWGLRWRKRWQYGRYVASRGYFHARALLPTVARMLSIRS